MGTKNNKTINKQDKIVPLKGTTVKKLIGAAYIVWGIASVIYLVFSAAIWSIVISTGFSQARDPLFMWIFVTLLCTFYAYRGIRRLKRVKAAKTILPAHK